MGVLREDKGATDVWLLRRREWSAKYGESRPAGVKGNVHLEHQVLLDRRPVWPIEIDPQKHNFVGYFVPPELDPSTMYMSGHKPEPERIPMYESVETEGKIAGYM